MVKTRNGHGHLTVLSLVADHRYLGPNTTLRFSPHRQVSSDGSSPLTLRGFQVSNTHKNSFVFVARHDFFPRRRRRARFCRGSLGAGQ